MVERICASLGHRLTLTSRVGSGSRFEVRLPRATSKPGASRPARRKPVSLEGLKVLCLDDEPPVVEAMAALLGRWGCQVQGARTRAEAFAAFGETAPDAVLVDYRLADGDTGPSVYEALCAHWSTRPPGLMITAERGSQAQTDAAACGLEVIAKPAPPAVLRASLASLKRRGA